MASPHYPPVGASAVERVLLCDQLVRSQRGKRPSSSSLPGHLIQLVLSGRVCHEVSGRRYTLEPNSLIWYHEDELVRIEVLEAPWTFYTLNFLAPTLSPPPFEHRVQKVRRPVRTRFRSLLEAWRDLEQPRAVRELMVRQHLNALLGKLLPISKTQPWEMNPSAQLWWSLESELRQDLSKPMNLTQMVQLTGRSQATIARSCQEAVGMPPMKRLKQIRMSLARGLLQRSTDSVSQISQRVGYLRVHEFSRDYRKYWHVTASEDRLAT